MIYIQLKLRRKENMAKPFVKWAGGKSQLINIIDEKIGDLRQKSKEFIYVEPFVGGGSVLFHLLETCSNMKYAVINDANKQLMNAYKVIADDKKYIEFKDHLYNIQTEYNSDLMKKEKYILYRYQYNHWIKGELTLSDAWGAAAFIFLNKCGFNGLYRVNQKGEFNVPWGQKEHIYIFNEDELDKCHIALGSKVAFMTGDYRRTDVILDIAKMEKSDIIYYFDPPYKPVSQTSSFTSYTKDSFNDQEQVNLKLFCDNISNNGGKFLLSNSKCGDYFDNLYSGYTIDTINAKRMINSVGSKRGNVEEILIHN
jgi:DNA adenine methylase